jgi:heme/copper-type cytochrome/quinol oxidase subunit 1
MQAGGAAGMPRRFADWAQGGWMIYGMLVLVFGLVLAAGIVYYLVNLKSSEEISPAGVKGAAAEPV